MTAMPVDHGSSIRDWAVRLYRAARRRVHAGSNGHSSNAAKDIRVSDTTSDVETLRHAFATTAADRDRLAAEVDTYRHAFETTAADRDRLTAEVEKLRRELEATRQSVGQLAERASSPTSGLDEVGAIRIAAEPAVGAGDDAVRAIAQRGDGLFKSRRFDELLDLVVAEMGATRGVALSDDCARGIAAYWMACLHCAAGDTARAEPYARLISTPASPDGMNLLPFDLVHGSHLLRVRQMEAIGAGRPGVMVVGVPGAGADALVQAVSEIFGVPILRTAIGSGVRSVVVPQWAAQIAEGGAVTNDQFAATVHNLDTLKASGISAVWVLVGDPRDIANRRLESGNPFAAGKTRRCDDVDERARAFVAECADSGQWIASWAAASERSDLPFTVSLLDAKASAADIPLVIAKMLPDLLEADLPRRVRAFLTAREASHTQTRVPAKTGAWRRAYPDATIAQVNAAIPTELWALVPLEP